MSFQALNWARTIRGVSSNEKNILLLLASYADEEETCFPSQSRLASEGCMSVRTVRSVLCLLEDRRLISRRERFRPNLSQTTDRFTLHVDVKEPVQTQAEGAANLAGGAATVAGEGAANLAAPTTFESPDTNLQSSLRSDSRPTAPPMPDFDEPDPDNVNTFTLEAVVDAEFADVPPTQLPLAIGEPSAERFTRPEAMRLWNEMAKRSNLALILDVTDARWKALKARTGRRGIDAWYDLLAKVEASAFLQGRIGGRGWKCDFDWVLKPANWQKIIEDGYDDRHRAAVGSRQSEHDRRLQQMVRGAANLADRIERGRQGGG